MKRAKSYIAAAIFILLTIIKIAFPTYNSMLVHGLNSVFEMEDRQTEAAIEFGREVVNRFFGDEPMTKQESMKSLAPEKRSSHIFGDELRQRMDSVESVGVAEKEKADKVATFASAQAEFTDAAIPQSVLMEMVSFGFDYASPVEGVKSSGFGYRIHPISGELKFHYGTDFAAYTGTPIKAFADGSIIAAGESDSYGKYIIIDHGRGYSTLYAHCSELCMGCGEVKMGDVIALVGETGLATGAHLHFEIKCDSSYINPEFYL